VTTPPIQLLLSDVDGTLVTPEKTLTPASIGAALEVQARGIGFTITSGRPPRGMAMLIEPLQLKLPIAGFNGGVFVNPDLSVIESHALDFASAKAAHDLILARGLDVWLYTEKDWFVRDLEGSHVAHEAHAVQFLPSVVGAFAEEDLAKAIKIVGVSEDFAAVEACEAALVALLGKAVSASRSQSYYLDVTHPRANKGAVVESLSRILSVPCAGIATIGDMPNDVEMFKVSGFSIAMGNATEAVKSKASVATDSNRDDGFAKALRRYILS
jgi:Cof subfamily protein (haloacid dehalogenase superfamily)